MIDYLWGILTGIFFGLAIACGYMAIKEKTPEDKRRPIRLYKDEELLCKKHCQCPKCKLFGSCPELGYESR